MVLSDQRGAHSAGFVPQTVFLLNVLVRMESAIHFVKTPKSETESSWRPVLIAAARENPCLARSSPSTDGVVGPTQCCGRRSRCGFCSKGPQETGCSECTPGEQPRPAGQGAATLFLPCDPRAASRAGGRHAPPSLRPQGGQAAVSGFPPFPVPLQLARRLR